MTVHPQGKLITAAMFAVVIGIIGYYVLNAPDNRSATDKIVDAVDELPKGIDKATRQLEDRTPGEKLNDAAKDLKRAINQQ